jgi:hypothetical protein
MHLGHLIRSKDDYSKSIVLSLRQIALDIIIVIVKIP